MKNLSKNTEFDKHWEDVFQDAEMSPPDKVWSQIDSDLSKQEAGHFKRKAFMFKLLAAASIAFAMGIGLFSLNYYLENESAHGLVESEIQTVNDEVDPANSGSQPIQSDEVHDQENRASGQLKTKGSDENITGEDLATHEKETIALNSNQEGNESARDTENTALVPLFIDEEAAQFGIGEEQNESHVILASLNQLESQGITVAYDDDLHYQIDHIYLIPIMPRGASKKRSTEKDDNGILMASLDFSAGQFNPNFEQGASNIPTPSGAFAADSRSEMASFNATNKNFLLVRNAGQETKPELTYSYGANLGFKVTSRFLVQTGFAYRKSNTTTTTTGYIENPGDNSRIPIVASYQYQLAGLSKVKPIDETNLSNQYEFASIPIRAGYVLLNKKINLTLLAGISSEFFINNSISDGSNYLETLSSSDAAESPYKNVYFNGTLGTMLGYSFAKNYSVTIEPSYRMAINSFTKDSFYLSSYPSSFMVSFGVAYNFR